jgi:uncharacterized membrane protein
VVLVLSAFVLCLKLLQPASIRVYIGNSANSTVYAVLPQTYTQSDIILVSLTSLVLGISTTILFLVGRQPVGEPIWRSTLQEKKKEWERVSKGLRDDERSVYEAVLEAEGIIEQGQLVEKTGLSKATVSRTLDLLESKGLVEKRRRGLGNVVSLK